MKTLFGIKLAFVVFCVLHLSMSFADTHSSDPTIIWDEAGNIHIFANSMEELYFAWGWAQMRDNTELLLDTIETRKLNSSVHYPNSPNQIFADGMNGFLNRRLETLSPSHRELLPLYAIDVQHLESIDLGEWQTVFLHSPEFQGAGISTLGAPQINVDNSVEAVSREVLIADFKQLELLLPLTPNE